MLRYVVPWKATGPGDVTLLSAPGRRLAKLITPDGIVEYDGAVRFQVDARRLDDIDDLPKLLEELAGRTDTCVIRAALKRSHQGYPEVVRRIRDRPSARPGQIVAAPFAAVPRRWVMVDIEPAAAPAYIDPTDPVLVGGYLRRLLPAPFPWGRCIAQLSSGTSIKPGLRAHLWFWLDRALDQSELDRLLGGVPGVDISTFRAVQPHFTAAPVLENVDDPCTWGRIAVLPGYAEVAVPALPEPPKRAGAYTSDAPVVARPYVAPPRGLSFRSTPAERYMLKCLEGLVAAPPGQRHPTIVRVSARLFGLAKAGALDRSDVSARIQGAVAASSFDRDTDEVISALRWAWDHSEPWKLP